MLTSGGLSFRIADLKTAIDPGIELQTENLECENGLGAFGRPYYSPSRAWRRRAASRTYEGDDPAAFVVSLNLKRRHLSESQRAMIAARLANIERGGDRKSVDFKSPIGGLKQAAAAEMLNVSPKSVERAKTVQKHGIPELQKAVEQGEVAVSAAAKAPWLLLLRHPPLCPSPGHRRGHLGRIPLGRRPDTCEDTAADARGFRPYARRSYADTILRRGVSAVAKRTPT